MLKWAIILGLCVFVWALFSQAQAAEVAVQPVTLQDSLVSIIQQVQSGVSAGVSFLSAEIPDVIRQLLLWKMVEAIVTVIVCVAALIAFGFAVRASLKHDSKNYWSDSIFPVSMFGGLFIALPSVIGIYCMGLTALQIWIAPKVWLIEYAASLVK